ncbi:5482_t:CDS:2, partial [Racocetra persica]
LIPPLSVLAIKADIHEKFIISVKSAVIGGMRITWEQEEMKTWRNVVLMKLLYHSNLAPSKHRLDALYDAFTKTSVLGPEHILALAR